MGDCDATNPLISACQCDGSMRLIHLNCLRQWIREKCHRREVEVEGAGTVVTWTWRQFECEICKQAYPLTFVGRTGERYDLVEDLVHSDIPQDKNLPHLLMESMPFEKSSGRVIHLIKPTGEGTFKMGRGHES